MQLYITQQHSLPAETHTHTHGCQLPLHRRVLTAASQGDAFTTSGVLLRFISAAHMECLVVCLCSTRFHRKNKKIIIINFEEYQFFCWRVGLSATHRIMWTAHTSTLLCTLQCLKEPHVTRSTSDSACVVSCCLFTGRSRHVIIWSCWCTGTSSSSCHWRRVSKVHVAVEGPPLMLAIAQLPRNQRFSTGGSWTKSGSRSFFWWVMALWAVSPVEKKGF